MKYNFDACYLIIRFWDFSLDFTERVTYSLKIHMENGLKCLCGAPCLFIQPGQLLDVSVSDFSTDKHNKIKSFTYLYKCRTQVLETMYQDS